MYIKQAQKGSGRKKEPERPDAEEITQSAADQSEDK